MEPQSRYTCLKTLTWASGCKCAAFPAASGSLWPPLTAPAVTSIYFSQEQEQAGFKMNSGARPCEAAHSAQDSPLLMCQVEQ